MFIEPQYNKDNCNGWIEVICGPMFSGKTEELLRRLRRAKIAQIKMVIFKPAIDTRYSEYRIVSHDTNYFPSLSINESKDIIKNSQEASLIALDEAQFFDEGIIEVLETLAIQGKRIIVAGLDMDYKGLPFGPMPKIMAIAEYVTKLNAICVKCGGLGTHSYRLSDRSGLVLLGEKDHYEPRCRKCFYDSSIS